jgi:hypothetical protein
MGYAVKATNHRAMGIQDTAPLSIQGAHHPHCLIASLHGRGLLDNCRRLLPDLCLLIQRQRRHPLEKVEMLQQGVMIKTGQTAIVLASGAGKPRSTGGRIVSPVHAVKQLIDAMLQMGGNGHGQITLDGGGRKERSGIK